MTSPLPNPARSPSVQVSIKNLIDDVQCYLWLAALNPDVRHVVEHTPWGEVLGRERMLFNLESAMER
jgi:hypothetical protein